MGKKIKLAKKLPTPWLKPWPKGGLEPVAHCPICCETVRTLLHSNLMDNTFRVAPGKWALWKCMNCKCAYLDPRPTQATISLAYASYYTHETKVGKEHYVSLSLFRKLRRCLVNGYTNWRYGTHAIPSSRFGILATFALPNLKKNLDREYRHLPRLPGGGGRLLDIGSGDGSFLHLARTWGWDVVGIEPDSMAVANTIEQGLTVYEGSVEFFDGKFEQFDVITMNHVIEHVHNPVKVLKICYALLKPGGQLWLETPNIDSLGYSYFDNNWRGLEAPRHLTLFNRSSLIQATKCAGFTAPQFRSRPSACTGMFKASFAIKHGFLPIQKVPYPKMLYLRAKMAALFQLFLPSRREFLTMTTCKKAR